MPRPTDVPFLPKSVVFLTSSHDGPRSIMSTATLTAPLFQRIHEALQTNPFVPGQQVQVEANEGRVVLKGSVRSFFQKQMAQEAVRHVEGVEAIDNRLTVLA